TRLPVAGQGELVVGNHGDVEGGLTDAGVENAHAAVTQADQQRARVAAGGPPEGATVRVVDVELRLDFGRQGRDAGADDGHPLTIPVGREMRSPGAAAETIS